MRCRHCGHPKVTRPRGLCWTCFYRAEIRAKYPSTSKFARRGNGNFCGNAPLPPEPTRAIQGTPEKIEVLAKRAKAGLALWHPNDGGDCE